MKSSIRCFSFFRYIAISIDFNPSCTISYRVFYNCIFYLFFFWNTINKFLYKLRGIQIFFAIFLSFFLYLNERKYEIEKTNFLFSSE